MYKLNAFIVDPEFLKNLEPNLNNPNFSSKLNLRNLKQFSKGDSDDLHLTFAVSHDKLEILRSVYKKKKTNALLFRLSNMIIFSSRIL